MDCKDANNFIMKYMDKILTDDETVNLNAHMLECERCNSDFLIYKLIMDEFSGMDAVIKAPDNFEADVMEKIHTLGQKNEIIRNKIEYFLCFIWGIFSFTATVLALTVINRDPLISYLSANDAYSGYIDAINSVSASLLSIKDGIAGLFYSVMVVFAGLAESLKYFSLAVIVVIIIVQFFVYRKDKVEI